MWISTVISTKDIYSPEKSVVMGDDMSDENEFWEDELVAEDEEFLEEFLDEDDE